MEFKILRAFVGHRGQVLTHDRLIAEVWGKDVLLTGRVIYTHVNNLRQKIEVDPAPSGVRRRGTAVREIRATTRLPT
jgi:DNA-binding response OmpR family regulator